MDRQGIKHYLDAVWGVVADANRYFAGEEPWAKRKTDFERMETILYVTAEVVRQVAILAAAGDAGTARQAARLPGAGGGCAQVHGAGRGGAACGPAPPSRRQRACSRATSSPGLKAIEPKAKKPKPQKKT